MATLAMLLTGHRVVGSLARAKCRVHGLSHPTLHVHVLTKGTKRHQSSFTPPAWRMNVFDQCHVRDAPRPVISNILFVPSGVRYMHASVIRRKAHDHYKILGLKRTATQSEIKTAYYKLAKKYHPDRTGHDQASTDKFAAISQAYEVLGNEEARQKYDRGETVQPHFDGSGPGGYSPEDMFRAFEQRFGKADGKIKQSNQGRHRKVHVTVSLSEAALGTRKEVETTQIHRCLPCGGTGVTAGTTAIVCPRCGGAGEERGKLFGFWRYETVCPKCGGGGMVIPKPCVKCAGRGRRTETKTTLVDIPPGVEDGDDVVIAGMGDSSFSGGAYGNLKVKLTVENSSHFRREGTDILSDVTVTYPMAVFGGKKTVDVIDGQVSLEIPPGSQHGTRLPITGRGMGKGVGGERGDHIALLRLQVPTKLTAAQANLLRLFEEASSSKEI